MKDPFETKPPKVMVEIAKRFLKRYVDFSADEDTIDEQVDVALFEWKAWIGRAFNQAVIELGLVEAEKELKERKTKITKSQLKEMIRNIIREQLDPDDVLQRNLGGEGKNILKKFIKAIQEATKAWSDLHKYFEPSEEADEAMIEELKKEVELVDDNLLAWLEQVALKAME